MQSNELTHYFNVLLIFASLSPLLYFFERQTFKLLPLFILSKMSYIFESAKKHCFWYKVWIKNHGKIYYQFFLTFNERSHTQKKRRNITFNIKIYQKQSCVKWDSLQHFRAMPIWLKFFGASRQFYIIK